jgi:siroheme synthase-like protein
MDEKDSYLPLFFNLTDRPCLVVGGGVVALRKVKDLLQAGAAVTVVSPEVVLDLRKLADENRCRWLEREYQSPEGADYQLVVATTDNPDVNRQVYEDCNARAIPVNVVDQPHLCSVIFPAAIRRGMITAAISSGGKAPFFTRYVKERLETFLDEVHQLQYPEIIVQFREFVKSRAADKAHEDRLFRRLLACDSIQWYRWSRGESPEKMWRQWLKEEENR